MAPYNPVGIEIQLLVTDRDLNIIGDPITEWQDVDVTVRFNRPGSGYAILPAYDGVREQIAAGNRIILIRNGAVFNAGPIERYLFSKRDDGDGSATGTIAVHWADDLATVAARITYPDPTATPADQLIDRWEFDGNAEVAIRSLANLNAGPGALTARRIPKLVLGDVAGVGSNVEVSTRLQPLCDDMRAIALSGGGLGFRTRQVEDQILFEVYEPADLSGDIRFGFELGNTRSLDLEVTAPTATAAIVGGQGQGADRRLVERVDSAGAALWGRMETMLDRRGSQSTDLLDQDGDEALEEAAETVRLATNVFDSDGQRFGVDFGLGDRVSVVVWPGHEVADVVRTAHLSATPSSGEIVTIYVGSSEASSDPQWVAKMRELDRKLFYLATNAEVPTS